MSNKTISKGKNSSRSAFKEALKISVYLLAIPFLLIAYLLYTHPETEPIHYVLTAFILLLLIVASIFPFVRDVIELTEYFKNLLYRREAIMPLFNSFAAASQLPQILTMLKNSWEDTNQELSAKVLESRIMFNTIPNIILILNSNLIITSANDAAHNVLGANLIGQEIETLINDKNLIGLIRVALHEKIGKNIEVMLNDVIPRFYRVKIELFGTDKYYAHQNILIVFDDITETKRTEQTFKDFVSNASHEIRTPITSIIGMSETLIEVGYDDKEAFHTFLPMIKSQANRMNQLVNDLLNLATIEMQVSNPPSDLVDIIELIEFAATQLEWAMTQSKNQLVIDKPANLPHIIADRSQMIQVFYNLIANAIKYGKENEKIIISVAETSDFPGHSRAVAEYDRMLTISVQDFGEGISPENIKRLTERFFRVDQSRSKKVGGNGLGLAIVKQIIIRHNGYLDIKSQLNHGSIFTVYLPIYDHYNSYTQE